VYKKAYRSCDRLFCTQTGKAKKQKKRADRFGPGSGRIKQAAKSLSQRGSFLKRLKIAWNFLNKSIDKSADIWYYTKAACGKRPCKTEYVGV
jgi:hypothetical protein